MTDTQELILGLKVMAEGTLAESGAFNPFFIGRRDDGGEILMAPTFEDFDSKRVMLKVIGMMLAYFDCTSYGCANEAWVKMASLDEKDTYRNGDLAKDPDRKEIMMFLAVDRKTRTPHFESYDMEIHGKSKILRPSDFLKGADGFTGGFTKLFDMYDTAQEHNLSKEVQRRACKAALAMHQNSLTFAMKDFRDPDFEEGLGVEFVKVKPQKFN